MLFLLLLFLGLMSAVMAISLTLFEVIGNNPVRKAVRSGGRDMYKEGDLEDGRLFRKGW